MVLRSPLPRTYRSYAASTKSKTCSSAAERCSFTYLAQIAVCVFDMKSVVFLAVGAVRVCRGPYRRHYGIERSPLQQVSANLQNHWVLRRAQGHKWLGVVLTYRFRPFAYPPIEEWNGRQNALSHARLCAGSQ